MKITQLRNATIMLELESKGGPIGILVDPMLADRGALPSLRWLGATRRRNPLVSLPTGADAVLGRVTHSLITHCQRGHFDHLDRAGTRFLRERGVPVVCMPRDERHLSQRSLNVQALTGSSRQPFFHGHITPIPCVHGHGVVGKLMEHGFGYFIELPGEPSIYLAGDTILSEAVRHCLTEMKPDVSVLPAGGARFDVGDEILMNASDVCEALGCTAGIVVANHLEALDHCPVTREELLVAATRAGVDGRLVIPADGQMLELRRRESSTEATPDSAG